MISFGDQPLKHQGGETPKEEVEKFPDHEKFANQQ